MPWRRWKKLRRGRSKTKTPDEIRKGLECKSGRGFECMECPYNTAADWYCWCEVMEDALEYIKRLEKEKNDENA